MRKILRYLLVFQIIFWSMGSLVSAEVIKLGDSIGGGKSISDVSVNPVSGGDTLEKFNNASFSALHTAKVILSGIMLIYLVYLGFQMIMAMGADDKLSATKRQLYYTLIAFLFINIPGQLYGVFTGKVNSDVTAKTKFSDVMIKEGNGNTLVNFFNWNSTIENGVISFINAVVIGIVIMQFMFAGIGLISSGGNDEKRKKARIRFLNGVIGLIFLGLIQSWIYVVYSGDIPAGQSLFAKITNLALFFTGPIAIFFLIMGGFYYVTSAGDEAKAKKGATIIKNTFVAVIILLACYAFLKDLADFKL